MIAVKQRIPIPIILEIYDVKVRKELYINFTLIKMLPKQKNTPHISHGAVYFKERCMMKRYV